MAELVSLWAGARYSVYIFRRYTDLRLVISPELQVAYFGGDYDNFTYPRYDLDMTFYRVYDDNGEITMMTGRALTRPRWTSRASGRASNWRGGSGVRLSGSTRS